MTIPQWIPHIVKYKAMSWMTAGIIHKPMTFILDTYRLCHTGKL